MPPRKDAKKARAAAEDAKKGKLKVEAESSKSEDSAASPTKSPPASSQPAAATRAPASGPGACARLAQLFIVVFVCYMFYYVAIRVPKWRWSRLEGGAPKYRALNVIIPLPSYGFDPTEVAVPWQYLKSNQIGVVFATPDGKPARADERALRGWLGGLLMRIQPAAEEAYNAMLKDELFAKPITYEQINWEFFDGAIIPGGHHAGVNDMLNSEELHFGVARMVETQKVVVGAICHGVLLLARAKSPLTDRSLLWNRKATTLPKYLEWQGHMVSTYIGGDDSSLVTTGGSYTEDEVRAAMQNNATQFKPGPTDLVAGIVPGTADDDHHAYMYQHGNLLTARFWGDSYMFAKRFLNMLLTLEEATRRFHDYYVDLRKKGLAPRPEVTLPKTIDELKHELTKVQLPVTDSKKRNIALRQQRQLREMQRLDKTRAAREAAIAEKERKAEERRKRAMEKRRAKATAARLKREAEEAAAAAAAAAESNSG